MKKFTWPSYGARGIFVIFLLLGVSFVGWSQFHSSKKVVATNSAVEPEVVTYSVEQPDTERPKPTILPKGTQPSDPVYISLPTIAAEGDIVKVGVDQDGAIAVPNTIHRAGWFVNSVRPGEKGLSIIDGHVDPRTNVAIFQRLAEIKVGDAFEIRLANGATQTYVVRDMQTLSLEESALVLFSQLPRVSYQLNLITCAGTYDQEQGLFTHRVVVAAELII